MDDAVGALDVGRRHLGAVNHDAVRADLDGDLGAVDGGYLSAIHGDDGAGHHLARHDMVREDVGELRLVLGLDELLDGSRRQLGEGGIRRREHGERPRTLHGVDEAGSTKRCGEGLEGASAHRSVNDIWLHRGGFDGAR